jgi:indolepyruvate decarboxylase
LDATYSYNEIPRWNYSKLPDAMGGIGRKAGTIDELRTVLEEIRQTPHENFVIEVSIPSKDTPEVLWPHLSSAIGEDEIENPNWPPESKY